MRRRLILPLAIATALATPALASAFTFTPWSVPGTGPNGIVRSGSSFYYTLSSGAVAKSTLNGVQSVVKTVAAANQPGAIVVHPNGDVWFTEPGAGKVGRIFGGNLTEPATGGDPVDLAVAGGNVWVIEKTQHEVDCVTADGAQVLGYALTYNADPNPVALAAS